MSSNFERLHEIINEAYAENFSCLSHWEPKKRHLWASISENPVPLIEHVPDMCCRLNLTIFNQFQMSDTSLNIMVLYSTSSRYLNHQLNVISFNLFQIFDTSLLNCIISNKFLAFHNNSMHSVQDISYQLNGIMFITL